MQVPTLEFVQGKLFQPADGIHASPRPFAATADGNAKLTHFKKCGTSITAAYTQAGFGPLVGDYFAGLSDVAEGLMEELQNLTASGDDASSGAAAECEAQMRCARPAANKTGGEIDIKCTVGALCAGVPLPGTFLSVAQNECFTLYVTL